MLFCRKQGSLEALKAAAGQWLDQALLEEDGRERWQVEGCAA